MASIFKQQYTVKDKEGSRIRKKSQCWYIEYKDSDGRRVRRKGYKDKTATRQLADKLEREAALAEIGVVDKYKEHRKRPLSKHLEDFKASLLNKGDTEKQARLVHNRAKAVVDNCRFIHFDDLSASRIQRYLAERRREGLSIRTSNFYLQAIKQVCNWLVADGRTNENPVAYLKGQNPKTDIRHPRRALSIEELERLIQTTQKARMHSRMVGKERALLYMLAVSTGLRANELASLTWENLNLTDSKPFLSVLAGYSKHRREDIQPLRVDITEQLKEWKDETGADDKARVFPHFNPNKGANILKRDLEAAGIDYVDPSGRYADFHALRHTLASQLIQSGVSPKVAQSIMRHSTVSLTMDTYTHIELHDERDAIEKLPALANKSHKNSNGAQALKTGTDDLPVKADKSAYRKLTGKSDFCRNGLTSNDIPDDAEQTEIGSIGKTDNTLPASNLDIPCHLLASNDRRGRDSNPRYNRSVVRRFSKPLPSATRPPLQVFIDKTLRHFR